MLSSIQKENKVIKLLQQENEDLKESLEEHQSVLEIIMSKYRQQMLKLIKLKKEQELTEHYYKSKVFQNLQEKTDQIAEMAEVMKKAIELDERQLYENEEKLQMLLVENRGLKEMLKIRNKYGTSGSKEHSTDYETNLASAHLKKANLVDQEIQTDEDYFRQFLNNNNSINNQTISANNANENTPTEVVPFQLDESNTVSSQSSDDLKIANDLDTNNSSTRTATSSEETSVEEATAKSLDDSSLQAAADAVESVVEQIEASQSTSQS